MSLNADLSPKQLLSANYLNNQLLHFTCVWQAKTATWSYCDYNEDLAQAVSINEKQETIVLVGQAINFQLLESLFTDEFIGINRAEVQQHPLSSEFSQQVISITLTHSQALDLVSKQILQKVSERYFIDCFLVSSVSLKQAGLLVMDMDSTIINMECIDEIAALVGVGEKVSALTERAMQGELDFNQSLNARVACLAGVKTDELAALKRRLPINPGFAKTIQILQQHGWHTCIASGGFTYFADYLKDTFELSLAVSNTLGLVDDRLNGKVEGPIVNGEMKRDILLKQAQEWGVPLSQTVAIGDGANDLLMMDAAALGVAYKAKPKVKVAADASIAYCGFEGLLFCLK